MTKKHLLQTLRLWSVIKSTVRVNYQKKKKIFGMIGENVTIMDRKIPLYAELIRIHNNVRVASNVTFVTHDITHTMLNVALGEKRYQETVWRILKRIEIQQNKKRVTDMSIFLMQ